MSWFAVRYAPKAALASAHLPSRAKAAASSYLAAMLRDPSMHGRYLGLLEKRFKLKARDLRRALSQVGTRTKEDKDPGQDGDENSGNGDDAIEGEIYEDTCFYYTVTARGETKTVSSFTLTPTMRVEIEDGEMIFGRAYTDKGNVVEGLRMPLRAFHSKKDLIRYARIW